MQTITYPNTANPMIVVQDDGSVYYYNAQGKIVASIEQNRMCLHDSEENILIEVQGGAVGDSNITIGRGAAKITIDEDDGSISFIGKIIVNGTLISPIG